LKPADLYLPPEVCRDVGRVLDCIGSKWSVLLMRLLAQRPHRFSELKRNVSGVSQKMLTATLRDLERNGFVTRKVTPTVPARVDYALSALGRDVMGPLDVLARWALANERKVTRARERFDAARST
jgi:DNA-binding HxlR family transcriptional regulator